MLPDKEKSAKGTNADLEITFLKGYEIRIDWII